MGSVRHLPPEREGRVEVRLRAPGEQIKPRATPLGICRTCGTIVYAGQALAMAGCSLMHDGCCAAAPATGTTGT
jgi:hypothetical protein